MGADGVEVEQTTLLNHSSVKVHHVMCTQLLTRVDSLANIFPEIEAARPRCSLGIKALCDLQNGIEKARQLVHNCSTSSKLYLAITGEAILSRCERTRNLLVESLSQLQTMVPVSLQFEITQVLSDLTCVTFNMDSSEEEVGKAIRSLLQQDSTFFHSEENCEIRVLQFAASKLHIKSQKDLLIEKRSIKRLLDKVSDRDPTKKKILKYLFHLLKKYNKQIVEEPTENLYTGHDEPLFFNNDQENDKPIDVETHFGSIQAPVLGSLETSNSLRSVASSLNGLHLQIDISNVSIGSLNNSYGSDLSNAKVESGSGLMGLQFYQSVHDLETDCLSNLSTRPWELQRKAIEDVNVYLKRYKDGCISTSSETFLEPLVQFLKDAYDRPDAEAQKSGCQLFLTYLRSESPQISEDIYFLLSSYLNTAAMEETLAILELLSAHEGSSLSKFASSGALTSIIEILNSPIQNLHQSSIKILSNLILNKDNSSSRKFLVHCIPALVPFLRDAESCGSCIVIFDSLCEIEKARVLIAETDGCISSIVELLSNGRSDDQDHAASVLLSLCLERIEYCKIVMNEGVIPALVYASINGSVKGKATASELLRLLHSTVIEFDEQAETTSNVDNDDEDDQNCCEGSEKQMNSKGSRFFGMFGKGGKFLSKKK